MIVAPKSDERSIGQDKRSVEWTNANHVPVSVNQLAADLRIIDKSLNVCECSIFERNAQSLNVR